MSTTTPSLSEGDIWRLMREVPSFLESFDLRFDYLASILANSEDQLLSWIHGAVQPSEATVHQYLTLKTVFQLFRSAGRLSDQTMRWLADECYALGEEQTPLSALHDHRFDEVTLAAKRYLALAI